MDPFLRGIRRIPGWMSECRIMTLGLSPLLVSMADTRGPERRALEAEKGGGVCPMPSPVRKQIAPTWALGREHTELQNHDGPHVPTSRLRTWTGNGRVSGPQPLFQRSTLSLTHPITQCPKIGVQRETGDHHVTEEALEWPLDLQVHLQNAALQMPCERDCEIVPAPTS
ncbi:nitrilase-like protein 1 [Platysternon megacephalum]|uniref:Nitrilase-like protein 1 n=1 Tax=Platysternon megacephalum TaxID=55544 RepID=A0A4D9EBD5_9SAUR|nr:nitrilase-like protein 1 [Platysternon megacephalum]